jgi:poly-gamma-glutamate capsule biosynthesis protein CapA/YwtB (metallophosphatase superfamily)
VTWQNVGQKNRKRFPTTATPPAIRTKYPLATHILAAGLRRIIAMKKAVPVQGFNSAAAGAALLLKRKSRVFNP